MSEPDDSLSRLIALKRFEQPPPDFTDRFLSEFRERQRRDLMKLSLREMIMERIEGIFERLSPPQLTLATASVAVVLAGIFVWLPQSATQSPQAVAESRPDHRTPAGLSSDVLLPDTILDPAATFGSDLTPEEAARLSPLLLSRHFVGGYADEARESVIGAFNSGRHGAAFEVLPQIGTAPEQDMTASEKAQREQGSR